MKESGETYAMSTTCTKVNNNLGIDGKEIAGVLVLQWVSIVAGEEIRGEVRHARASGIAEKLYTEQRVQ